MGSRNRTHVIEVEAPCPIRWTIPTYKIAAILETVGFEPTPQFLQNRFKEKIADRFAAYTDLFLVLPLHHVSIKANRHKIVASYCFGLTVG